MTLLNHQPTTRQRQSQQPRTTSKNVSATSKGTQRQRDKCPKGKTPPPTRQTTCSPPATRPPARPHPSTQRHPPRTGSGPGGLLPVPVDATVLSIEGARCARRAKIAMIYAEFYTKPLLLYLVSKPATGCPRLDLGVLRSFYDRYSTDYTGIFRVARVPTNRSSRRRRSRTRRLATIQRLA